MGGVPLFEMAAAKPLAVRVSDAAFGASVEAEVVAVLLRLGHKVAVPVVDDDGVDLIVDYRVTVQVKSRRGGSGTPRVTLVQNSVRRGQASRPRRSAVRAHVDLFVFFVEDVGWWVIPREVMSEWSITLGPEFDRFRDAWHLVGEARRAAC